MGFYRYDQSGFACLIVETPGCHSSEKTGTTSGDGSIEKKQTPRHKYEHYIAMHIQEMNHGMVLTWPRFILSHVNWSWFEKGIQIQTPNVVQIIPSCIC